MASEAPKVFISYNRADCEWADWIEGVIKGAGYEPILEVWHFRPGENFVLRMEQAGAEANLTLAVLSEAYLEAVYTQPEWATTFAQDPTGKNRRLIPLRVGKCAFPSSVPVTIRATIWKYPSDKPHARCRPPELSTLGFGRRAVGVEFGEKTENN